MTAGTPRVEHLVESGAAKDFLGFEAFARGGLDFPPLSADRERQALEASDRIIVHSPHVRFVLAPFAVTALGPLMPVSSTSPAAAPAPGISSRAWGRRVRTGPRPASSRRES
jgi:hypothetical protein